MKHWVFLVAKLTFGLYLFVVVVNFLVDPYVKFRYTPSFAYDYNDATERFISGGLARHLPYTTAMVGTSMIENFTVDDIDKTLQTHSVKLPFSGGSAKEFSLLLNFILDQHHATHIFYALDMFSYRKLDPKDDQTSNYDYMFHDDPIAQFKYLTNTNTTQKSVSLLIDTLQHTPKNGYKTAFMWASEVTFDEDIVKKDWDLRDRSKLQAAFNPEEYSYKDLKENFDRYLYPLLVSHPNMKFTIFYPPYSYLTWKLAQERGALEEMMRFKAYTLSKLVALPNVEVFDFQHDPLIYELDNYKDISHYSDKINHLMLERMAHHANQVTPQTLTTHLQHVRENEVRWREMDPEE
jgi:hypothetical protein